MLIRLEENVSKISFLDVNIINFLLDKNVNIFLLEENINNFFYLNVTTFHWVKVNVQKTVSLSWFKIENNLCNNVIYSSKVLCTERLF